MSSISKQALKVENSTSFPDNNTGYITPSLLRAFNVDMIDSTVNQASYSVDIAAIQSDITALEAFTASQQPSFTALNSFTASQIVTNNALNAFTQSATQELDSLSAWTGSWEAWTSSLNEIRDDGVLQGYSTRFFFNGLVSASVVDNVDGKIANVTIQQDGTKLNTASFNDYTQTINAFTASQNSFNASATASLVELLNLSSSLSGGYVTEGELNQYTQSVNQSIALLSGATASYATTGSNGFFGNQNFNGNILVSGSVNLLNEGGNGWAFSSKALFLTNSVQTGLTVDSPIHFYKMTKGNMYMTVNVDDPGSSGSLNMVVANNQPLNISASAINITKGDINLPYNSITVGGNPLNVYNGVGIIKTNQNYSLVEYGSSSAIVNFGVVDANAFTYSTELLATATPSQITFQDFSFGSFQYETWMILYANNGSNPKPFFNRGIQTSGSVDITGSVYGNVSALTISSNTASIDLSKGNFFSLTLAGGATTHLTATNIKPGQTINLLITQPSPSTGSVTYSSTFKFPAGANYVPTPITGSQDIVTLISYDTTKLYATSINNLG